MPTFSIDDIFKRPDTKHRLTIFKEEDVNALEAGIFEKNGKPYLKCLGSGKDRPAKPEEIVRQLWVRKLIDEYGYTLDRLKVEHPIQFGREVKRANIVVMDKDRPPSNHHC